MTRGLPHTVSQHMNTPMDERISLEDMSSLRAERDRLQAQIAALAAALRELVEPDFTYERVHSYYTVCAGQIAQTSIAAGRSALAAIKDQA